ncbi:hypothetical protein BDV23DRAFT_195951 [Aspergillus alliaceus]|uniref:Uncharacterized protein n=1 Tax=Petromyces alliaceus TaxID=209559 RepID=A0A5N7BZE1_PETAA|nr:uncharacterized protein BDW43DRAFT_231893 [Aspergillus alliaceus]KAB8228127.1 hypothetical protein BDW43DRAFT_231893 [Aspergillus alliaceus]KAE8387212.1 hypothetical protein BDV23DRAFT_195951 [Aspergillus alliaceus]
MAHQFYTPEDEVGFEPQSKRDALLLPHSTQISSQQEAVDRTSGTITPILEGEKSRSSTRRRIPVACNRCRKRKIKCSGDIGDGHGCSNCRNSGNQHCQFLRVNSSMLQTKASGWPYPATNTPLSSAHQRQGAYTPSVAPKQEFVSVNTSNFRIASLSRPSAFDISSAEPQQSHGRPLFGQGHIVNYEDESSTVYGSQPPTYVVPTTLQGVTPDYYGIPWSKTCHSGLSISRGPDGGVLPEHEAEGTFHQSNYAYIVPEPGTQSPDPTFAPSMIALSSEAQGADRTLPNPNGRGQLQLGHSVFPTSSEAISGLPQLDCRIGHPWTPKGITDDNTRSMRQYTLGALNGNSMSRGKPPPPSAQEMVIGYPQMSTGSTSSPLLPSRSIFTRLNPGNSGEELQGSEEAPGRRSMLSTGARFALMEGVSDIYRYSSSEKRKGLKPDTSGTLMNGLPYTRPPEQHENTFYAFSLPVADGLSGPGTTAEAQRTQTLSNPGSFYPGAC